MGKFIAFLKLIRFPNLFMLALVQLITWIVFIPNDTLPLFNVALISFATVLIAAGGYLINDYYDYNIDIFNKKRIDFTKESIKSLSIIYFVFGLSVGLFLSSKFEFELFILFVIPVLLLWLYASFLSKLKVIGNILISLLIVESIIIIILFSTYYINSFSTIPNLSVIGYAFLAFIFNYIREIVKDIEDIDGDRVFKRKTIPILFGLKATKIYLSLLFILTLYFLWSSQFYSRIQYMNIVFPICISLTFVLLIIAKKKKDFKRLSLFIKLIMLLGLLSPLLFKLH